eukprot:Plantae.Rhodophyta-Hildenbrandia_rubra.ctg11482.p1 GENE.Plantae.Rhodophyta-Hildenbrandia_rubra.ctg11482~~Plantae.Rhodophyta-Hildenbrandia_rubra.ctg11482.p1  ORF type:complete len:383 (-),score=95.15 Plantae.Rhodophyta-Hildenbrandia_rubra.ctg11482:709-1857(-)
MKYSIFLLSIFLSLLCVTGDIVAVNSRDTATIKQKLKNAEQRVRDLATKLDTVSSDAGRAKQEIHSTLLEAWKVVELLGQDRCGEVGEKYRKAQLKAEGKVVELMEEVKANGKEIEGLKLELVRRDNLDSGLRTELDGERSRRQSLEAEVADLKDKLHWASAIGNDSRSYEVVAEKMDSLNVIMNQRINNLAKIQEMIVEEHKNYVEWKNEMSQVAQIVKDAERDFVQEARGAATESMKRYTENIERRLKEAVSSRDTLQTEMSRLRKSVANKKIAAATGVRGATEEFRRLVELRKYGDWKSTNSIGFWTLVVVTFCCGMLLARYLSVWQDRIASDDVDQGGAAADMGYTPGKASSRGSTPGSGYIRARYSDGNRGRLATPS